MLHSDKVKEYYASTYQALLKSHNRIFSMSRMGNCWDNAMVESLFHIDKLCVPQQTNNDKN